MILELDWMNVSSASNDIRRNDGNIVGVGSHARQISQELLRATPLRLVGKRKSSRDSFSIFRRPPTQKSQFVDIAIRILTRVVE